MILSRGNVYWADLGHGEKPWLVVSNNARNNALPSALVARITTTTKKPDIDSVVQLEHADLPLVGRVLCDEVETLYEDEVSRHGGALTPGTMMRVDRGLRAAFALR